jgi:flagellar motor switch protein FliM
VNLALVEQFTYGEFIMSLPNPTQLCIFSMKPLEGMAVMEVNPALVFVIVDRLTGGSGSIPKEIREFTEIEQAIMLNVITMVLEKLQETWKHVTQLECKLEVRETNPQFAQVASMTENVLLITFNAEIGENTGMISICIPFAVLGPVLSQLSAQQWISSQGRGTAGADSIFTEQLQATEMCLKTVLGRTEVSIEELVNMSPGDVVVLDRSIRDDCELWVEDSPKYRCKPGLVGQKRAAEIRAVIEQ